MTITSCPSTVRSTCNVSFTPFVTVNLHTSLIHFVGKRRKTTGKGGQGGMGIHVLRGEVRWGGRRSRKRGVGASGKGVSDIQVLTSRAHEIPVLVTH